MMVKIFISIIFQVKEGFRFTLESLAMNKLRTFLSLFGITIGIFSIISVFTVLDSFQASIQDNFNTLGANSVYVQKMNWGPEEGETEYKWWKYLNRPEPTYKEFEFLEKNLTTSDSLSFMITFSSKVQYGREYVNSASIIGATHNYFDMRSSKLSEGRYFTSLESNSGRAVALIGREIADELFAFSSPLGKDIKVKGRKFTVIGVLEEEGSSMIGNSADQWVMIPYKIAKNINTTRYSSPAIIAMANSGSSIDELKEDITIKLRSYRRLAPLEENNFSVNSIEFVIKMTEQIFMTINLAGGIIGMFAMIVGGFGIANIMFVSVRERMSQIGIQKALGAKNYVILLLFLFEAIFLSIVGGIVGLLLIYIATLIATNVIDFPIALTLENILLGVITSAVIGAVAGFIPAYNAARMEPVKAIYKL